MCTFCAFLKVVRDCGFVGSLTKPKKKNEELTYYPWLKEYRYAGPRASGRMIAMKLILDKGLFYEKTSFLNFLEREELRHPLYKKDREDVYWKTIHIYNLPKPFAEENRYRRLRL